MILCSASAHMLFNVNHVPHLYVLTQTMFCPHLPPLFVSVASSTISKFQIKVQSVSQRNPISHLLSNNLFLIFCNSWDYDPECHTKMVLAPLHQQDAFVLCLVPFCNSGLSITQNQAQSGKFCCSKKAPYMVGNVEP